MPAASDPAGAAPTEAGRSSLRSGVAWSLLSFAGTKALTLVSTLILARILAPSQFGVLAAILAFITVLELLSDLGMKATVIYESEKGFSDRVHTAFTLNLLFTIALTLLAVASAPFVARFFDAEAETALFMLAAADVLVKGLGNIHDALLLRDMELRGRTIAQVLGNLVRGVVTIALALAGLGASALVIGFIAGTVALTGALWILKPYRPKLLIQRSAVRSVAVYGGWASALEVLAAVAQRADVAVIGGAIGVYALGLYTIAQRLPELVIGNVTWNLSIVAFPALARRRDEGTLTATTLSLVRYSALFGLPTAAGMAVLAPALIVVLFGAKWSDAGAIMQPLSLMYGVVCIVFPLGDTFKALGKQATMVVMNLLALPVALTAMILAAPGGVVSVAWARTLVTVAMGVVWILLMAHVLDIRLSAIARELRPGCAAAAGVALGAFAVTEALPSHSVGPLALGIVAAVAGGAVMLRLFGAQQYAELQGILTPLARRARSFTRRGGGPPAAPAASDPSLHIDTPESRR